MCKLANLCCFIWGKYYHVLKCVYCIEYSYKKVTFWYRNIQNRDSPFIPGFGKLWSFQICVSFPVFRSRFWMFPGFPSTHIGTEWNSLLGRECIARRSTRVTSLPPAVNDERPYVQSSLFRRSRVVWTSASRPKSCVERLSVYSELHIPKHAIVSVCKGRRKRLLSQTWKAANADVRMYILHVCRHDFACNKVTDTHIFPNISIKKETTTYGSFCKIRYDCVVLSQKKTTTQTTSLRWFLYKYTNLVFVFLICFCCILPLCTSFETIKCNIT